MTTIHWIIVGSVLLILGVFVSLIVLKRAGGQVAHDDQEELISLVFLLKGPQALNKSAVEIALSRAFGPESAQWELKATDRENFFGLIGPEFNLGIMSVGGPYVHDRGQVADNLRNTRQKIAIQNHNAWLAIDLFSEVTDNREGEVYQYIGKLLAEFAGDNCLALYYPSKQQLIDYGPDLLPLLRSGDPLEAFKLNRGDPLVAAPANDADLKAAAAEARRRWPEFVSAFEKRRPKQGFAVKSPFSESSQVEHMWIEVTSIQGESIAGTLANEPGIITKLKLGDRVNIHVNEIEDWIISDGERMIGGFSVHLFENRK